jgi:hypothetical protein
MGYNRDSRTITVGPDSDFLADSGLHFIYTYRDIAHKEDAPASIKRDWQVLEEWLGCLGRELSKEDERIIRSAWLGYYAVGLAPSFELQPAFDHFATTHNVKEHLKNKPPTFIMDVFDRMQATDDDIAKKREHDVEEENKKKIAAPSSMPKRSAPSISSGTSHPPPQFPNWMRDPERLRKVIFVVLGLLWWIWLDKESSGFSYMSPAGWLVTFAVPTAFWFGLPHVLGWLRGAVRDTRLVFSANVMWVFLVATWGYIWHWDNELSSERYLALFILPSIAAWIGLFLWRWSKSE